MSATPTPVLSPINGELKLDSNHETSMPRDRMQTGVENIPPPSKVRQTMHLSCVFAVILLKVYSLVLSPASLHLIHSD